MDLSYFTVDAGGTLLDAAQAIARNKSRCVVVTDEGKAVGVISEGDLVRALLRATDITAPMEGFIRHGFQFLESRDLARALALFRQHGISLIPVLDKSLHLVDAITLSDVLERVELPKDAA